MGSSIAMDPRPHVDLDQLSSSGFVGVTVIGAGNVDKFLNAFFLLAPWNTFYRDDYLDDLLLSPDLKPLGVILNQ